MRLSYRIGRAVRWVTVTTVVLAYFTAVGIWSVGSP